MKKMTSIIALLLVLSMLLCACGNVVSAPETETLGTDTPATEAPAEETPSNDIASIINLEDGMPVVNEPVSVTIALVETSAAGFERENNWLVQYLEQYSGLDITWESIPGATAAEKVPMMLNSGDMPDAIMGYSFTPSALVKYGQIDGTLMPINDLLQYMPALSAVYEEKYSAKSVRFFVVRGKLSLHNFWRDFVIP